MLAFTLSHAGFHIYHTCTPIESWANTYGCMQPEMILLFVLIKMLLESCFIYNIISESFNIFKC